MSLSPGMLAFAPHAPPSPRGEGRELRTPASSPIRFSNRQALRRPYSLSARGTPSSPRPSHHTKCEGVERRTAQPLASRLAASRAFRLRRVAVRHSTCGFSVPGAGLPGADPGRFRPPRPEGFRPPSFRTIVQPLRADPPSGAGRLAGASRAQGYEPCPRAPPPPRIPEASCRNAPRVGWLVGI